MDETDVKVRGEWAYLYRAVDKHSNTIDFYLSPTRNTAAAKRFLVKVVQAMDAGSCQRDGRLLRILPFLRRRHVDGPPRGLEAGRGGTFEEDHPTCRQGLRYTLVRLKDGTSAALMTNFVCVDFWDELSLMPLLFETQMVALGTGCFFDAHARRYASRTEAMAGHAAGVARLRAIGAEIRE